MKKYLKYIIIGIITGLCNGLFGSGGGTIAVPAMEIVLDVEEHRAHATALAIILPLTLISAFFYIQHDYVNWNLTWQVSIGGIIGGYIGAKILKKIPANILRKIFGIFMIIAAVRMVM
ncbi:MAG: sulfite exporter TauE/SafE family protein [Clostridia bacterium]